MKIFINSGFKGDFVQTEYRIRRNLVSIYKLLDYEVVDTIDETVDVAQFIGVESFKDKINTCLDKYKMKVIVNYFIDNKYYDKKGDVKIPFDEKKILNKVNLVIVPTENEKKALEANEITSRIEVVTPGANLNKFENLSDLEKDSFLRYSGMIKGEPYAIAITSYKNTDDVLDLITLAKRVPYLKFYVFGPNLGFFRTKHKIMRLIAFAPKNIKFRSFVNEDLYKSAVLLAKFFVITKESNCEILNIFDAEISKTQIVSISSREIGDVLINGQNCLIEDTAEKLSLEIQKVMNQEKSTIEEGFKQAQKEAYPIIAKKLDSLIKEL
jgi:hypothetical protein